MNWRNVLRGWAVSSRLAGLVAASSFSLAGCVNQPINDANKDEMFRRFTAGQIQLSTSLGTVGNNIWFADKLYEASVRGDWSTVAKIAIESNNGDDIGYFYLGLAAENFHYSDAARTYYQLSIDVSRTGNPPPQCTPGVNYIGAQCHGLVLPRDAYAHLRGL